MAKVCAEDVVMSFPSNIEDPEMDDEFIYVDVNLREVIEAILDHIGLDISVQGEERTPQKTVLTKKPKT